MANIVVTGANRGIGKAVSRQLAAQGFAVLLRANRAARLALDVSAPNAGAYRLCCVSERFRSTQCALAYFRCRPLVSTSGPN